MICSCPTALWALWAPWPATGRCFNPVAAQSPRPALMQCHDSTCKTRWHATRPWIGPRCLAQVLSCKVQRGGQRPCECQLSPPQPTVLTHASCCSCEDVKGIPGVFLSPSVRAVAGKALQRNIKRVARLALPWWMKVCLAAQPCPELAADEAQAALPAAYAADKQSWQWQRRHGAAADGYDTRGGWME